MFGTNQKMGGFADPDKLQWHSIFSTIQGEGYFTGQRATFIRLSNCNLSCHFCDAFFDTVNTEEIDTIVDRILQEEKPHDSKNLVVITGGEPFRQKGITKLVQKLIQTGREVQIETNGTLYQPVEDAAYIVCSPKNPTGVYSKPNKYILSRDRSKTFLKFVVSEDEDCYKDIPEYAKDFHNQGGIVYVSPINTYLRKPSEREENGTNAKSKVSFYTEGLLDREQNRKNHNHAAMIVMRDGYRLSLQTHLYVEVP